MAACMHSQTMSASFYFISFDTFLEEKRPMNNIIRQKLSIAKTPNNECWEPEMFKALN